MNRTNLFELALVQFCSTDRSSIVGIFNFTAVGACIVTTFIRTKKSKFNWYLNFRIVTQLFEIDSEMDE